MPSPSAPGTASAPWPRDAVCVGALALVVRLGVVLWAGDRFPPAEDGYYYHVLAERLAAGEGYTWLWPDGTVTAAAHYPVGYPAALASLYSLLGARPVWAMSLNAALGALAAVAAHRLAATAASRKGAALAGVLVALHPALVFYTGAVMTEGVVAALLTLSAWLAVRARAAQGRAWWAHAGGLVLVSAAATLVRPQSLLIAPFVGMLAVPPSDGRRWLRPIAALAVTASALALCMPWTLRNCARMDRCVLVSANGGWNLLIGSGEGATGAWVAVDQVGFPPQCREVFGEAAKDGCFLRAALDNIRERPIRWLGLVPAKLAATFDYSGAPGWYLHAANPEAFGYAAKVRLGAAETFWQRGMVLLALLALAAAPGPRRRARRVLAAVSALFLFVESAWVAHVGLVLGAALLGRTLLAHPPAFFAAASVGTLAVTHAVFFGAGRYALVGFPAVAALAGAALTRAGRAGDTGSKEI